MEFFRFTRLICKFALVSLAIVQCQTVYASINLSNFSETHDVYKDEAGAVLIIGKPDYVDIPFNVDIPYPSLFASYKIDETVSYTGEPTGFYQVTPLGEGYIADRSQLTELSDEADYKISDFDSDTELEISIHLTEQRIGYFGFNADEEGVIELELENDEYIRSIGPSTIYENIGSEPDRSNNLPAGLKGSFSVSAGGAGSYNLPLSMPPGINGFTPKLSVSYNTNTPSGLMGLGWQLGGLDMIRRCSGNAGLDADGDSNSDGQFGITFTETDRLCRGNDQLVLSGEEQNYWAEGVSYRLQDDQGVVFERLAGGNIQYTDQGGLTTVFKSIDPMHWGVETITDLLGNVITVEYEADEGVGLIPIVESVQYGAYRIAFNFPWGRNDPVIATWLNQPRVMSRYLSSISYYHIDEVTKTETPIKEYKFHYQDLAKEAKGPLLLRSIQDCRFDENGENSRCLRPLDISYSESDFEFSKALTLQEQLGDDAPFIKNISSIDWDHDGKSDLMISIERDGVGKLKAYLSKQKKLIEIVSADKGALYNSLDFFALPDGTKGVAYQKENSFSSELEKITYGGRGSEFLIPRKYVATGRACTKMVTKVTPRFKVITLANGKTRKIEMSSLTTQHPREIPYRGDLHSSHHEIEVWSDDPQNPGEKILIQTRRPDGVQCFDYKNTKGWYLYYAPMVLPTGEIEVGERYSHSLQWNVDLFTGKEATPAGSAFLPMQYCGLSVDAEEARKSMSVYPTITDLDGDGATDIIVPLRNNDVTGNCSKLYEPENKWSTSYVNLFNSEFIGDIKSSINQPLDLSSYVYTDQANRNEVAEEHSVLKLNVPSDTPASLYLMQHGTGASGLLLGENGQLVSVEPAVAQEDGQDPRSASWRQTTNYSRNIEVENVTLVNAGDGGIAGSFYSASQINNFNEFYVGAGGGGGHASLELGDTGSIRFSGAGGVIGSSGTLYSANNSQVYSQDVARSSLRSNIRFTPLEQPITPLEAVNGIPLNTYADTQITQVVPEFTETSNFALTSAEHITGQTVSAALDNEISFGSSDMAEDYEANFISSFDPYDTVFADFNRDGKTDALSRVTDSWKTEYSIQYGGSTVFQTDSNVKFFHDRVGEGMTVSIDHSLGNQMLVFDYDRQGCLDVLMTFNDGPARIYRCHYDEVNNTWFEAVAELPAGTSGNADNITMLDYDGDGFQDIAIATGTGIDIYTQEDVQPILATKFANVYESYEDAIDVGYSTLTELSEEDLPRYTYSSDFDENNQEYISAQTVVESVQYPVTSYSNAVKNVERYSYYSAKFDHDLLRFLGFEKVSKSSTLFGRKQDIYYYGSGENGTPQGFPESLLAGRPVRIDVFNTFTASPTLISSRVNDWALTEHTGSQRAYARNVYEVSYDKSGNEIGSLLTETVLDETQWGRVSQVNKKQGYASNDPTSCVFGDTENDCVMSTVVKDISSDLTFKDQSINFLQEAANTISYHDFNVSQLALDYYGMTQDDYAGAASQTSVLKHEEHASYANIVGVTTSGITLDSKSAVKTFTHISSRAAGNVIDGSSMVNAHENIPLEFGYLNVQEQKTLVDDWESGTFPLSTETYLNEQDIFSLDQSFDPRFGAPTSVIEPTGETTYIEYDLMGMPVKTVNRSAQSTLKLEECGAVDCKVGEQAILGAVFKSTRVVTDTSTSESSKIESYSDAYGRVLATKTFLPESKVIVSQTLYDQRGRREQVVLPCFESDCANEVSSTYSYFDTEEKMLVTSKDGASSTTESDFSASGKVTVTHTSQTAHESDIQDLEQATRSLVSKKVYDGIGQLIESTQFDLDGTTALTSVFYQYDVAGRLIHTEVKDLSSDQSQHTLITYDDEVLTQTLNEPNTGRSTSYVDVLGRMRKTVKQGKTSLTNAAQAAIESTVEYDAIGRVLNTWDSVSNQTDRYVYDEYETTALPASFAALGTYCPLTALCEVISGDGKTHDLFNYWNSDEVNGINLKHVLNQRKGGATTEFKEFMFGFHYDGLGRLTSQTLPSGKKLNRNYSDGVLSSVALEAVNGELSQIYSLEGLNHFGQFNHVNLGNGAKVTTTLDSLGRLKGIKASSQLILSLPETTLFEEHYALDSSSTMLARNSFVYADVSTAQNDEIAQVSSISEQFIYDGLRRLAEVRSNTDFSNSELNDESGVIGYDYDRFGNLLKGESLQGYNYSSSNTSLSAHCDSEALNFGTGPHTVRNAENKLHCYDQFGRVALSQAFAVETIEDALTTTMSQSDQRRITYNAIDKPLSISTANGNTLDFEYGPDEMRQYSVSNIEGVTQEVYYLMGGAYEYVEKATGEQTSRYYIDGVAVYEEEAESDSLKFFVKDYLGSTKLVLSENLEEDFPTIFETGHTFTPFGLRALNTMLGASDIEPTDRRGFTGHEHFEAFGIIHMNGRIYDPELGRFLSADPLVSNPYHSQSYNRYSYVMNNPMSFTDPSGYTVKASVSLDCGPFRCESGTGEDIGGTGTEVYIPPPQASIGDGNIIIGRDNITSIHISEGGSDGIGCGVGCTFSPPPGASRPPGNSSPPGSSYPPIGCLGTCNSNNPRPPKPVTIVESGPVQMGESKVVHTAILEASSSSAVTQDMQQTDNTLVDAYNASQTLATNATDSGGQYVNALRGGRSGSSMGAQKRALSSFDISAISGFVGGAVSGFISGVVTGAVSGAAVGLATGGVGLIPAVIGGAAIGGIGGAITGGATSLVVASVMASTQSPASPAIAGALGEASQGSSPKNVLGAALSSALNTGLTSSTDWSPTSTGAISGAAGGIVGGRLGVFSGAVGGLVGGRTEEYLKSQSESR